MNALVEDSSGLGCPSATLATARKQAQDEGRDRSQRCSFIQHPDRLQTDETAKETGPGCANGNGITTLQFGDDVKFLIICFKGMKGTENLLKTGLDGNER